MLQIHLCSHAKYFSRIKQIFQETALQTLIHAHMGRSESPHNSYDSYVTVNYHFSVNVWCGIVDNNCLIGHYDLPDGGRNLPKLLAAYFSLIAI
jgi:trehalose-6-phosphate synthase